MVEAAALAASAAAAKAPRKAMRIRAAANAARDEGDRDRTVCDAAQAAIDEAADRFHEAETDARARQDGQKP